MNRRNKKDRGEGSRGKQRSYERVKCYTNHNRFSEATPWRIDHNIGFKRESIMGSWTAAEPNNFYFGANVITINQPCVKCLILHNQAPTNNKYIVGRVLSYEL